MTVTVLLLLASWVYPPGLIHRYRGYEAEHGWFFLFATDSQKQVDFGRLILLDAIITVGGLSVAYMRRSLR